MVKINPTKNGIAVHVQGRVISFLFKAIPLNRFFYFNKDNSKSPVFCLKNVTNFILYLSRQV